MKLWKISEQETSREIMSTDVFVKVASQERSQEEMDEDVARAFEMFCSFEQRMSRFILESELSCFNRMEEGIISQELFLILSRCKRYYVQTGGIFDPSILANLKQEGYGKSFKSDQFGKGGKILKETYTFSDVELDEELLCARKPKNLEIDLGGIGKGYIVDRVTERLGEKYDDIFVCAGGDIAVRGADRENGYDFWASDIENPFDVEHSVATLVLRDNAVATSGTNRRKWEVNGNKKHHLIDPRFGRSAETDVVSVTVVAHTAEEADVLAKTLCILGSDAGMRYAQEKEIATLFVRDSGAIIKSKEIKKYIWRQKP